MTHLASFTSRPMLRAIFSGLLVLSIPAATGTMTAQAVATSSAVHSLGKQFSISLQLAPGATGKPGLLLRLEDGEGKTAIELDVTTQDLTAGNMLRIQVFTNFKPAPLILAVPASLLSSAKPHTLVLRDLGFRMDLLADGVLVDQEWPIGTVAAGGAHVTQQAASVHKLEIAAGVLADKAVEQANGGARAISEREQSMFGAEDRYLQYWRPRGWNTNAGDPMPFFHEGVLHVFFLLDRRHHSSKWGLGAHQWGHLATTDLIHWKTYPPALTIEREEEASICTGSVFFHGGKYYAFYATRIQDRSEHLSMAISDDGITFHKLLPTPFADPKSPYRYGPNRDPFVFGEEGDFHMIVTASLAHPATLDGAGALEHLTSPDLKTWTVAPEPFLVVGYSNDPECSDLFLWHDWYYLIFSENGVAHYRMSRSRTGPWMKPVVDVFGGEEERVMKTAAFNGDRRIGVAFVPDGGWYGGRLVFRELVQGADGTLSSRLPPEMVPRGIPVPLPTFVSDGITVTPGSIVLKAGASGSLYHLPVSHNFVLTATLTPPISANHFGLRFEDASTASAVVPTLQIDPTRQRISWENSPSAINAVTAIDGVTGLDKPMKIQLVAEGSMIDLALNGRHTLLHHLPFTSATRVTLFTDAGELSLTDLVISAVTDTQ